MSLNYTAPPTVAQFMLSDSFIRFIKGPIGSGKTTGILMEVLRRAIEQKKGPDGYRRTRWVIVRQTLSQMKMTILLDLLSWFRQFADYKVSEQLITLKFNDVIAEIYLIPLEDEEDQKRLLSMQLTGAVINECIEISVDLVSAIAGRCGRFPSKADGGPSWYGVIGDTNAPIEGSDWWKMMEENTPADWQFFHQPSGLSPEAENVENLPDGYYFRLAQTPNPAWVDRYVKGVYGEDPSGTAVFRLSFKKSFHVVDSLDPVQGQLLMLAIDFGRNPSALICQPDFKGRLAVLEEVIGTDVGLETQVARKLRPALYQERYFGLSFAAVGDPSGVSKGNFLEENSFDVLKRLGIPAFPAPTNNIDPRLSAVEQLLFQQRDGGPALIIDGSRCPFLVRALNGGYRFGKTKEGETKPLPDKKHPSSDLADCLQYVCLAYNAGLVFYIVKKIRPKTRERPRSAVTAMGWT